MGISTATARSLASACAVAVLTLVGACRRSRPTPSLDGGAGAIEKQPARGAIDERSAPSRDSAGPAEPDLPLAECAGWVVSATATGCLVVWSSCSDDHVRQVRCEQQGDHQACHCILADSQISSFESPSFCAPGGQNPSVNRALYTEAVRRQCGWRIGPREPAPPG